VAAAAAAARVSHSCACNGSPCLRHCVHGASIGGGGGGGGGGTLLVYRPADGEVELALPNGGALASSHHAAFFAYFAPGPEAAKGGAGWCAVVVWRSFLLCLVATRPLCDWGLSCATSSVPGRHAAGKHTDERTNSITTSV
jgi:hypothetical protein